VLPGHKATAEVCGSKLEELILIAAVISKLVSKVERNRLLHGLPPRFLPGTGFEPLR
jgi:hypothetical protein